MALFNLAYKITMKNEGGYANNPNDRGGETWRGIARNFWSTWSGWKIIDAIKAQHPASLNAALGANTVLETQVLAFYKQNFWDTEALDSIQDQQLANQLFDTAVNMGTGIASKFLQQGINVLNPNSVVVDGKIGVRTIAAANSLSPEKLYDAICTLRKQRYLNIIAANPSQSVFKNSWFSRITPYLANNA